MCQRWKNFHEIQAICQTRETNLKILNIEVSKFRKKIITNTRFVKRTLYVFPFRRPQRPWVKPYWCDLLSQYSLSIYDESTVIGRLISVCSDFYDDITLPFEVKDYHFGFLVQFFGVFLDFLNVKIFGASYAKDCLWRHDWFYLRDLDFNVRAV